MTLATLKTDKYGLTCIVINGRSKLVKRIETLEATSAGKWIGTASGQNFEIIGGRASGGASNEWFVSWDGVWDGHIFCNSMSKAVRLIENC